MTVHVTECRHYSNRYAPLCCESQRSVGRIAGPSWAFGIERDAATTYMNKSATTGHGVSRAASPRAPRWLDKGVRSLWWGHRSRGQLERLRFISVRPISSFSRFLKKMSANRGSAVRLYAQPVTKH